MPELPEVEVSRLGISPFLVGEQVKSVSVRTPKLRWAIPFELQQITGQVIRRIHRRAKYLLLETDVGTAIIHFGMSGSLRVLDVSLPPDKHDHVDLFMMNGKVLRYNDPRRFGAWLWAEKGKRVTVKQFIMDNKVVVGVGNIYANESLFTTGVRPTRAAGSLTMREWETLVTEIKAVLTHSIQQGGARP
jgi:formamidopyrimidine-DNA glycosylase